ncbi:transcriptional regulator, ArsR family protein [Synechococcus sp. PCC 7335]|uniref:ArsR/SmtB family transcription factor n=1 Tax=Synechococcus sp. (strain ATCC 29403 / PCC 7335) TaxID=91464 RepID=UPI00017EB155|nr:metalloregulator ArsR/SmtB family transcription factor [Synechococcus sp. PCC 7335]EDX84441.1 transcriptional regulator, ArsR family protein [Synechococcus sp. PCC 7335]
MDESSLEDLADAFAALGQPSRLRIVRLLLSAYPEGLPVGEIQKELGIAGATLSHHLDKLRQVGIVTSKKDRQWIWYRAEEKSLTRLIDFLFEECCTRNHVVSIEHVGQTIANSASNPGCCD